MRPAATATLGVVVATAGPVAAEGLPGEPTAVPHWALALVVGMIACGLVSFLGARRGSLTAASSFALLVVLIGCFLLFSEVMPWIAGWPSILLFGGTIAVLKLMSFFERRS